MSPPPLISRERERERLVGAAKIRSPSLNCAVSLSLPHVFSLYSASLLSRLGGRKLNTREIEEMEHDETGCQAAPEGPILCINNCGFFGSPATMNMCSKCHKDMLLKQEQAKLAASSIANAENGSSNTIPNEPIAAASVDTQLDTVELKTIFEWPARDSAPVLTAEKPKEGPTRCSSCKKRVGLTGFSCRCGNIFCGTHRYSDKHDCPFDYRGAARDAIAKANPVVKAEKLDKI